MYIHTHHTASQTTAATTIHHAEGLRDGSTARVHNEDDDANNRMSAPLRQLLCVSAGDTQVAGETKWPARRRSTHVWVLLRDPDVRKTVGLEVELKLNHPPSWDETKQAARLAIGGAGGSLPVQRAFAGCGSIGIFLPRFTTRCS